MILIVLVLKHVYKGNAKILASPKTHVDCLPNVLPKTIFQCVSALQITMETPTISVIGLSVAFMMTAHFLWLALTMNAGIHVTVEKEQSAELKITRHPAPVLKDSLGIHICLGANQVRCF